MASNFTKPGEAPRGSPLRQKTLVDTIYEEIRARLNRGEIGYEDRLLDYEIAEEFGCTRTPVRQALLRLVNESFLVGTTRGFMIPRLDDSDVREIFELRRLLEPPAAANAAPVLTDESLAALRECYEKTRVAASDGDVAGVVQWNIAFRSKWFETVPSRRLRAAVQTFADHAQQVRLQTLHHPDALKDAVECVRALMESFALRDPERARQAMFNLLIRAEQHYFAANELHRTSAEPPKS